MSIKTLPVDGTAADGIVVPTLLLPDITIAHDDAPPLADENDDTWIETRVTGPLDYMVNIATLGTHRDDDPIVLTFRFAIQAGEGIEDAIDASSYLFLQDGHPTDTSGHYYVGQFTNASWNTPIGIGSPYDGSVREMSVGFRPRPAGTGSGYGVTGKTLKDCLDVLASGDAWLDVNTLQVNDAEHLWARMIEAYLTVGTKRLAAPGRRRWPNPTGRGLGPRRQWPSSRTSVTGIN